MGFLYNVMFLQVAEKTVFVSVLVLVKDKGLNVLLLLRIQTDIFLFL